MKKYNDSLFGNTPQLICIALQLTGFYMTLAFSE